MNKEVKVTLLPIKTRVYHFDGNPHSGHGAGTIIGYNGIKLNEWALKNLSEAAKMAGDTGTLPGLVSSFYHGQRYPYVVQWDNGLKEVYEIGSITAVAVADKQHHPTDSFPDGELSLSQLEERYSRPIRYYNDRNGPQHPTHVVTAWKESDTVRSYWEWVHAQLEEASVDLEQSGPG